MTEVTIAPCPAEGALKVRPLEWKRQSAERWTATVPWGEEWSVHFDKGWWVFSHKGSGRSSEDFLRALKGADEHYERVARRVYEAIPMAFVQPFDRSTAFASSEAPIARDDSPSVGSSGPFFYVVDEGPNRHYPNLEDASEDAELQLRILRSYCDPEWPSTTDDLAVYECGAETDDPSNDGRLVLRATRYDIPADGRDDTETDTYSEYRLEAPKVGEPSLGA